MYIKTFNNCCIFFLSILLFGRAVKVNTITAVGTIDINGAAVDQGSRVALWMTSQ